MNRRYLFTTVSDAFTPLSQGKTHREIPLMSIRTSEGGRRVKTKLRRTFGQIGSNCSMVGSLVILFLGELSLTFCRLLGYLETLVATALLKPIHTHTHRHIRTHTYVHTYVYTELTVK